MPRKIVVTGASSGIGAASARRLGREGDHVILLARRKAALEEVAADVRALGGSASCYPVDLCDMQATAEVCQQILQNEGVPDVLFNNAGLGRWLYVEETEIEEAAQMMHVPYTAAFQLTRAFLPGMQSRQSGFILNITSPAGVMAWEGATAYVTARWAMRGFSKALQADLQGSGIRCSLLMLGKVSSEYFKSNPGSEERVPGISKLYKTLTPEEAADAVLHCIETQPKAFILPRPMAWTIKLHQHMPETVEWFVQRSGSSHKPTQAHRFQIGALATGIGVTGVGLLALLKRLNQN